MRQLVRKDNEAYAIQRNMRVSPSKANAVLEMIRGKKASEALNLLKFSSRGVAKNISKVLNSAIANAENNHQLDIDILKVTEKNNGLVENEIIDTVSKSIGKIAKPEVIHITRDLPKTRSGKIMRRILRKIANKDTANLGDVTTLADPSIVEELINSRQ